MACGASASAFIYVYVFAAKSNVFECANRGSITTRHNETGLWRYRQRGFIPS